MLPKRVLFYRKTLFSKKFKDGKKIKAKINKYQNKNYFIMFGFIPNQNFKLIKFKFLIFTNF